MTNSGVVAFGFGVPSSIVSNREIAIIAGWKARELNAPVFTQLDVQVALGIGVTFVTEKPGSPPPTLVIAREAVQWAKQRKINMLWISAASPHLWRCIRDLDYAIKEAKAQININICPGISNVRYTNWFCPDSTQKRTQSHDAWQKREKILRKMPMWMYRLVTRLLG